MPYQTISLDLIAAVQSNNLTYVIANQSKSSACNINQSVNENGYTLLQIAIESGNNDIAEYFLNNGAEISECGQNKTGLFPLHVAAKNNNLEAMSLLLGRGANVNPRDKRRMTPLHYAALYGQKEAVELLVKHGADVNARSSSGVTALQLTIAPKAFSNFCFAVFSEDSKQLSKTYEVYASIAVLLANEGKADLEIKLVLDNKSYSAIEYAMECNQYQIMEALENIQRTQRNSDHKRIEELENKIKLLEQQLKNNNVNNNNFENNFGQAQYLGKSITAAITPTTITTIENEVTTILTGPSMST